MRCAVVALTSGGSRLALEVAREFPDCHIYIFEGRKHESIDTQCIKEFSSLSRLFAKILIKYEAIFLIMSLGIVIRTMGPYLKGKDKDPAVLVLDEKGHFIISAVSGHLGGANQIAVELAEKLGALPVITTATDVQGVSAIDTIARSHGWAVEPVSQIKTVNGALANGEPIVVTTDLSYLKGRWFGDYPIIFQKLGDIDHSKKIPVVKISNKKEKPTTAGPSLIVRPKNLIVGLGCKKGIPLEKLLASVQQIFNEYQLDINSVRELASCTVKESEPGLRELADYLQVPIKFYSPQALSKSIEAHGLTKSGFVKKQIGVEGVCEPAAISGEGTPLLLIPKQKFPGITVAVAQDTSILSD